MVHSTAANNCVYSPVNPTRARGLQTFSQILTRVMRITAATTAAAAKRILCPQ